MKFKILIILILGLCLYNIAFVFSFEKIYPESDSICFVGKIISIKEEKDYYNKYILKVKNNKEITNSKNTKLILYTDKDIEFFPGDIVSVKGDFNKAEKATNYGGFNYRNYLKQEKIYGMVKSKSVEKISKKIDFYYIIGIVQDFLFRRIDLLYKGDYKDFLNGILLGNTSTLDKDLKESFRESSLSHILAISGMHVSYIVIGLEIILKNLIVNKKKRNYILIVLLIIFSFLTGLKASCLRAVITYSLLLLASNTYRKNNFYISLAISFIIILLINPFNLFNIGMWLSYFATIGIVIFSKLIKRIINLKIIKTQNAFLNRVIDIFSISVSAQILIFPITIYCFNKISFSFFISNILISFIIGPILALGYISILFSIVFFPIAKIIANIENILIKLLFIISKICSKIPFSNIIVVTPNFILVLLYYFLFFYLVFINCKNKYQLFRCILKFSNLKKFVFSNFQKILSIICIILIMQQGGSFQNFGKLRICFVDVGQGDCTVITTPKGKNIIIDGGEEEENVVLPYLLDRNISKIDYLIISHFDSDHVGGLFTVMENLKVKTAIISKQGEKSLNYERFNKMVEEKNIRVVAIEKGDRLNIEEGVYFDFLWPDNFNLITENILNNNSIVCKLNYNNFSILFTGDIEEVAEKQVLQEYNNFQILNSTILKIGHHGSKTSSSKEFLENVRPQVALIGVGKDNKFGHPNIEVLKRLEDLRD